jgi:hypothetical protein
MTKKMMGLLFGAGAVALAQAPPQPVIRERIEIRHGAGPGPMVMTGGPADFVTISDGAMSIEMSLVKGAPFSGEFVTETVQTLADGNRISSKRTEVYARDGEGRTRREMGPVTFIHDPVAKVDWVLENNTKTARKMKLPEMTAAATGGKNVMVFTSDVPPPTGRAPQVMTFATAGGGPMTELPKFATKSEPLGKRMIDGTEAEGVRTTTTIPAGAVGNQLPLETVSERWTSIELKTVVMTSRKDPRSGETTYKLTNLRKGEPSRLLFEAPADFTVQEGGGPVIQRMRIERKND